MRPRNPLCFHITSTHSCGHGQMLHFTGVKYYLELGPPDFELRPYMWSVHSYFNFTRLMIFRDCYVFMIFMIRFEVTWINYLTWHVDSSVKHAFYCGRLSYLSHESLYTTYIFTLPIREWSKSSYSYRKSLEIIHKGYGYVGNFTWIEVISLNGWEIVSIGHLCMYDVYMGNQPLHWAGWLCDVCSFGDTPCEITNNTFQHLFWRCFSD